MHSQIVIGMDEVGRGCWAGPLVVGAVALGKPIEGLRDSKQLSRRQRERLVPAIESTAIAWSLGWVAPQDIDRLGLTAGIQLAYERALEGLELEPAEIIIDGSYNFLPDASGVRTLVHADSLIPAVSAASILAKVARDTFMREMAGFYPGYGFERHVGYGTAVHRDALQRLGTSELHRSSFRPVQLVQGLA